MMQIYSVQCCYAFHWPDNEQW